MKHDLRAIAGRFAIVGDFTDAEPYGTGHINDTFVSTFDQGGARVRYIHQRINHNVFKQPEVVMANIERVLAHLHLKLREAGEPQVHRHALTIIPARDGRTWHRDAEGNTWRTYVFIEGAATHDIIGSPDMAYHAARAYGHFQGLLADLPLPRLDETIPDFHNTSKRFEDLEQAIRADRANRAAGVRAEIDFALARRDITGLLTGLQRQGLIPERITHNDTKLNNVMIDNATGSGICVIDLDTVMPGLIHYDFGDMVRSATRSGAEDERNLGGITMLAEMFEALTRGYLESAGGFLTKTEIDHLVFSSILITFEIGIRFLTDYLAGDVYFKVHRPGHNLDRCRTQFKMVQEMERERTGMERVVARYAGG